MSKVEEEKALGDIKKDDASDKLGEPNREEGVKTKVRLMPNGSWSIPFSCAWVMKRIE